MPTLGFAPSSATLRIDLMLRHGLPFTIASNRTAVDVQGRCRGSAVHCSRCQVDNSLWLFILLLHFRCSGIVRHDVLFAFTQLVHKLLLG